MNIFYDARDVPFAARIGSRHLKWLQEMGARPIDECLPEESGFLFAGVRGIDDYRTLVQGRPLLRDRAEERDPLLRLDSVLDALATANVDVSTPRTWRLAIDSSLPTDLAFPLFVRTATTSWKHGGRISRVRNERELVEEMEMLRRATQWNALILAREWVKLAPAGSAMYGPVPQEVRVWIADGIPRAWSFHYLNVLSNPKGFPLSKNDLAEIRAMAAKIANAFHSRLVAADFAKRKAGGWIFIEAGPGSCAGTAHEGVYKAVVSMLAGQRVDAQSDSTGGFF